MLLAYIDESGNTGDVKSGGSLTFTLGCVLIDADHWPMAFDELLSFRRRIRTTFGLPMRAEVKANYLLRNSGDLRSLSLGHGARRIIYRAHMRVLEDLPARAFGQIADLVAYAAFRAVVPPGAAIATVCPQDMWDEIGGATHKAVSGLKPRSKPGIVVR